MYRVLWPGDPVALGRPGEAESTPQNNPDITGGPGHAIISGFQLIHRDGLFFRR